MKKKLLVIVALVVVCAATFPIWKTYARGNKWYLIATNVGHDSLRRWGFNSRQIGQHETLAWPESDIPAHLTKTAAIYQQYLHYAVWTPEMVRGKRVIELGPGYTIAVPLLFAADGADYVVGIDKFVPLQDGREFAVLYQRMRDRLNERQKADFDRAIQLDPKLALKKEHAEYVDHKELSELVGQLGPGTYDMIVSNAVIEEIYDPMPIFKAQDALLRPGGVFVHRIDLRDYGMFSKHGFHPLEFLTVPDWIYQRMVEGSGQPDRRMADYYRELGKKMGYRTEVYVTKILNSASDLPETRVELRPGVDYTAQDAALVSEIRPRLLERYRALSDADLLTASIVFVGRK
ncbi:MAG TPA: methyltransferase domain-containing protein [Candidatus Solibacter sp.]|nr:methyltransferase domain-containing protein [Candidatus Solibacter sp.]